MKQSYETFSAILSYEIAKKERDDGSAPSYFNLTDTDLYWLINLNVFTGYRFETVPCSWE